MEAAVALLLKEWGDVAAVCIILGGVIWRLFGLLSQSWKDRVADRDAANVRADAAEERYAKAIEQRSQELERLANLLSGMKRGRP